MPRRTNFCIPEHAIERLKKLAQKREVSMSELVQRAIEEYLKREGKRKNS